MCKRNINVNEEVSAFHY